MHRRWRSWRLLLGLAALNVGCAGHVDGLIGELDDRVAPVELTEVPFHSQVTDQCGPAALASVLNDAGVLVSPDDLKSRVYLPERRGSLQLELVAATRHFGRVPYEIDPSLHALVAELDAGRPVLVLQNLGTDAFPVWHYAVVVGYLAPEQRFVLRSGDQQRHELSARRFARTWQRGDFWAIVALVPGELPAVPEEKRYLQAVAAFEPVADLADVATAYHAATEQWSQSRLAWLGLGNASFSDRELADAGDAYRKALEIDPGDAIVLNNLAHIYLELGCRNDALEAIDAALSGSATGDPVRPYLLETRREATLSEARARCM